MFHVKHLEKWINYVEYPTLLVENGWIIFVYPLNTNTCRYYFDWEKRVLSNNDLY